MPMQSVGDDISIIDDLVDRNCFAVQRDLAGLYGIALWQISPVICLRG